MAEPEPKKPKAKDYVDLVFDAAKVKAKAKAKAIDGDADVEIAKPAEQHGHGSRLLRRACCALGVVAAVAAVAMLVLSLTMLKVRDPTLSMDSVTVERFHVGFGTEASRPLRINVTLVAGIVIKNPNYESMRFGTSTTEFYVDGVPEYVGLGSAPPGEVAARGTSRVRVGMDVFVDRVGAAVVGEVLFGRGEVRLASHTAVDGRVSVLGGLYGRRAVRVAMRCRVVLRVSAAVVVAGSPSCVADFSSH
uniref:Late embryogenesis abundant protein LEA-2 subgroup domain-containing protein n=1 Tax=Oryza nivara TaxID=4536 RepID=A0A0E0GTE4_ORYNI